MLLFWPLFTSDYLIEDTWARFPVRNSVLRIPCSLHSPPPSSCPPNVSENVQWVLLAHLLPEKRQQRFGEALRALEGRDTFLGLLTTVGRGGTRNEWFCFTWVSFSSLDLVFLCPEEVSPGCPDFLQIQQTGEITLFSCKDRVGILRLVTNRVVEVFSGLPFLLHVLRPVWCD